MRSVSLKAVVTAVKLAAVAALLGDDSSRASGLLSEARHKAILFCSANPGTPKIPIFIADREQEAHSLRAWCVCIQESGKPGDDDPALCGIKQEILISLLELKAFDSNHRATTGGIVSKANPTSDDGTYKNPLAQMVKDGLIHSKKGRGGGFWLTTNGKSLAERL